MKKVGLLVIPVLAMLALRRTSQAPEEEIEEMPFAFNPGTGDARARIVSNAEGLKALWDTAEPETRAQIVTWLWQEAVGWELPGEPWSAVFVVAVVNAAVPGALEKSALHTGYAIGALKGKGLYEALRPEEATDLRPGDILIKPRIGKSAQFDDLYKGTFTSHGDIIVSVTDDAYLTIGGNKTQGNIAYEAYSRNDDGSPTAPVFVALRLKDQDIA